MKIKSFCRSTLTCGEVVFDLRVLVGNVSDFVQADKENKYHLSRRCSCRWSYNKWLQTIILNTNVFLNCCCASFLSYKMNYNINFD